MLSFVIHGSRQQRIFVAPRSVASVLEDERDGRKVAVLSLWDGTKHTVEDQDRMAASQIEDGQRPQVKMPPMVTKRKPLV